MTILQLAKKFRPARNNKGFTLIEIAIVLIIIGLIIGAAVKGKDLIQSAKQKKFYAKFLTAWELTVTSYYDRTGALIGDGTANGGNATDPNGRFDQINTAGEFTAVDTRLRAVGLTVPTTNTATSWQFTYKGEYSGTQTIDLALMNNGGTNNNDNIFRFQNMPTDLAMALDTMVDGQMDGSTGNFIRAGNTVWPDASTTTTVTAEYIIQVP